MRKAALAMSFGLACGTSLAEESDLVRQVSESIPGGFSGPLPLQKSRVATSHVWMQLRPGTSCAVSLVETAGQLDSAPIDRSDEKRLFMRLTRDAQAGYQVVHPEEEPPEEGEGRLQSSWSGTKDWKDASETWRSIPRDRGLAFLVLFCSGNDSKGRLEGLREALRGSVGRVR